MTIDARTRSWFLLPLRALKRLSVFLLVALVQIYRYGISPLLPKNCRYEPSCSAYAVTALRRYGPLKGGWLALSRICRCHPWGGWGYDPVPLTTSSLEGAESGRACAPDQPDQTSVLDLSHRSPCCGTHH